MIPELWSEHSAVSVNLTKLNFNKHKHLLKWNKNESILEFGCGNGNAAKTVLLPNLPTNYEEFVVTEFSEDMVAFVKENVNIPRLTVLQQDVASETILEGFENRFDHIFGCFVLHMLKNPRQALINVYKMLKPGGQAFLTCFERTPVDHAFDALLKHPKWGKYGDMMSAYYYSDSPQQDYENDLKAAGFKDYVFEVNDKAICQFDDDATWKNLYVSVNSVLSRIPEDEKEEYIECYLDICEKQGPLRFTEVNGKRVGTLHMKEFVIIATKP